MTMLMMKMTASTGPTTHRSPSSSSMIGCGSTSENSTASENGLVEYTVCQSRTLSKLAYKMFQKYIQNFNIKNYIKYIHKILHKKVLRIQRQLKGCRHYIQNITLFFIHYCLNIIAYIYIYCLNIAWIVDLKNHQHEREMKDLRSGPVQE